MFSTRLLILGAASALGLASPAVAQDSASTGDTPDWTGFHVGGALGYVWQPNSGRDTNERLVFDTDRDGAFDDTVTTTVPGDAFAPGFCRGRTNGNSAASGCSGDNDGRTSWSVHAGYDMQMGSIVVGGVVEGGRSYISNSVTGFSSTPASYTFTSKLDWDAAARLRAGFALPTGTLVYATGGLAYGKFENSFATTNGFNTFTATDDEEDDWGWTAGGGIEQKVADNFSIGVLYRYTRFNSGDYRVNAGQGTPPSLTNPFVITPSGSTDIMRSNDRFDYHSVRATASFRF